MAITTSQQLSKLYETYANVDITFTKDVIQALNIIPKQIFFKCLGYQIPCVIYSSSLTQAKLIAQVNGSVAEIIRKANNMVSLRFCLKITEKADPSAFFVPARVTGFSNYGQNNPNLFFVNLAFTNRPPDTLIEVFGQLLDANVNSKKRQEERIIVTPDVIRKIGLHSKDATLFVEKVPRKCILRDLSFGGAKVILMGVPKFLLEKECIIRLEMDNPSEILNITGSIVRFETVEGRKDIGAFAVQFNEAAIPLSYKLRVNDYIKQIKFKPGERDPNAT